MKITKAFKHALNMVLHAKIRSWLTILGIVIGVAAVISIVSLGEALEADINSQLGSLGADLVTLSPGRSSAGRFGPGGSGGGSVASDEEIVLDKTDTQILKGIKEIEEITEQIRGNVDVYYVAEQGSVSLTGVNPSTWYITTTEEISTGRMLGPADSNVVVIGGRLADGFFEKKLGVNQLITIEDRLFRIVGILDGTSTSIYMPITSAYTVLDDKDKDEYDSVTIKIKDEDAVEAGVDIIEQKLMIARNVQRDKLDFTLQSNQASQERRAEFLSSLTLFLTAIAAVALIVGSVGIANTMFTSVLEKTKEIGIMKAIGARNQDILAIFLFHAALIGLIGGIIGVILGVMLSNVLPVLMGGAGGFIGRLGSSGSLVSTSSIMYALSISVIIGIIAGIIPAWQASQLKPVDALRYE